MTPGPSTRRRPRWSCCTACSGEPPRTVDGDHDELSPDTWRQRDERIGSRLIRDRNVHVDCTTADYATG